MESELSEKVVVAAHDLRDAGRLAEADAALRSLLSRQPADARATMALGELLLSVGRYTEGLPLLEARTRFHPDLLFPPTRSYPEWRGEPLAGKSILVWVEQGHGDQIMLARFIPMLRARGARVTLACWEPVASLLAPLPDALIATQPTGVSSVPRHDYWSRYFSLPQHLGVTLDNLPTAPYLSAPADRRSLWPGRAGVGLMWQTSRTGGNGPSKSVPTELVQPLLDRGAVSLRPEDTGARDFGDTAAIIEQLDLVISVDTAVAHLAGAMGKTVWTLLPYHWTDWRWLRGRSDSPWYPSMRLFRQATADDWRPVIREVEDALAPTDHLRAMAS